MALIDLRSDTVTRPTPAMREAMARAEVGDDVFGDDPTVLALQAEVAALTGKEAALFVSSGTMGNQLAIAAQTRPGDEVIVGEGAHPVYYEAGAGAALSGVQFHAVGRGGFFTEADVEGAMQPTVYWAPRSAMMMVENTHNRAGGRVWPHAQAKAVAERGRALGLATHLDGARLWNASAASGISVAEWCAPFDTASLCFSKGLGAPIGSALVGPRAVVERAHVLRKRWGGGMRQVGILAAAALHALAHHRTRLADDHANARVLAEKMARTPGAAVDLAGVETNIVNIDLQVAADPIARAAREHGLLINASGPKRLRAVTHLDVTRAQVESAAEILAAALSASR